MNIGFFFALLGLLLFVALPVGGGVCPAVSGSQSAEQPFYLWHQ